MSVISHPKDPADDRRPAVAGTASDQLHASPAGTTLIFSPAQATPCPLRKNSKVNEVSA